jgi:hypothetical protein
VSTFTQQVRGRGARTNATGRYESQTREAFDDGWTPDDLEPVQLITTVSPEKAKVIITHNDSPDVGFSASINPYRGCEHGCIYCYARPAHAYMGCRPASISNPSCSSSRTLRSCWSASSPSHATCPK